MSNPNKSYKKAIAPVAMALLCLPLGALAQSTGAPVYNVNDSDIESRLTVLERKVDNRSQMQHRLQQQIDNMQNELDELRGAVEDIPINCKKCSTDNANCIWKSISV